MRRKVGSGRVFIWSRAILEGRLQIPETVSTLWNPTTAPWASFVLWFLLCGLHSLDQGRGLLLEVSLRNLK